MSYGGGYGGKGGYAPYGGAAGGKGFPRGGGAVRPYAVPGKGGFVPTAGFPGRPQPYPAGPGPAGRGFNTMIPAPTARGGGVRPGVTTFPAPQGTAAQQQAQQGPHITDIVLPFNVKTRRVAEMRARHLHRRHIPDTLLRCHAHWVNTPTAEAPWVSKHVKCEQDNRAHVKFEGEPEQGQLQARCLIVAGVSQSTPDRHIIRNIEIVAANRGGTGNVQRLEAYGGAVKGKTPKAQQKELVELVKQQSGVELDNDKFLRLIEYEYRDGRKTVFYVPTGLTETLRLQCQCHEEEVEVETEKEVIDEEEDAKAAVEWEEKREERAEARRKKREEAEAAAALKGEALPKEDDEDPERPRVMKKIKVTETKTKPTKKVQPMKMPLGNVLDFNVNSAMDLNTIELAMACDALDEYFKREMATRIWGHLGKVKTRKAEELAAAKEKAEKEQALKRKREEEDEARKKHRADKEAEVRKKWAAEDEGKTDDEKRALQGERKAYMASLWKDEDAELKAQREQETKELQQGAAAAKGKKMKVVVELDREALHAFQYFDRTRGYTPAGYIPRQRLEDVLQCLDNEPTAKEVNELISGACPSASAQVPYRPMCETRTRVEVEDPPAKSPTKSPAKEKSPAKGSPQKGSPQKGSPKKSPAKSDAKSPAKEPEAEEMD